MKFCFCVLHFKDSDLTNRCVNSVKTAMKKDGRIVVVDATHDYVPEIDSKTQSDLLVVPTKTVNPGFSRAMNYGASEAERNFEIDAFVFVNNDAVLADGFSSETSFAFEYASNVAAVGPKIVFLEDPSLIWSAGGKVSHFKMCAKQINNKKNSADINGLFETEFLSGCVVSVKRDAFNKVGGWPEDYLFGGEEWELSDRLRTSGGKLIVNAESVVWHEAEIDDGHGRSHSFDSLDFVINGYLNRKIYARNMTSSFQFKLFIWRLCFYIRFFVPLLWKNVAGYRSYKEKKKICKEVSKFIYSWNEDSVKGFSSLTNYTRDIMKKAGMTK